MFVRYRYTATTFSIRLFTIITLCLLMCVWVTAQENAAARPDRGVQPTGSYSASDIENISLTNGNVNLSIALATLPPIAGGKLSWIIKAHYNSKLWDITRTQADAPDNQWRPYVVNTPQLSEVGGWRISGQYIIDIRPAQADFDYMTDIPSGSMSYSDYQLLINYNWYKVVLIMPDGSERELRPVDYAPYTGGQDFLRGYYKENPYQNGAMRYYSFDGSFLYAKITSVSDWTVYMPDGTQVIQSTDGVQRIRDTNGNKIKIYSETVGSGFRTHYQDEQTGREISYLYDPLANGGNGQGQVWFQTVGGLWQHTDINFGSTYVHGQVYKVKDWIPYQFNSCQRYSEMNQDIQVIRDIILPTTEPGLTRKFSFGYNSDTSEIATTPFVNWTCSDTPQTYTREASKGWGALNWMKTPDGAESHYSYKLDMLHSPFFTDDLAEESITQKQLTHDNITDTWTYLVGQTSGTITNPDGSTVSEDKYSHRLGFGYSVSKAGLGYRTTMPFRKVERHWIELPFSGAYTDSPAGPVSFNPVVDYEYLSLLDANGNTLKMSAKAFQYDYNGNLVQQTDYDWFDPGLVTRDSQGVPTGVPASATVPRIVSNSYYNQATGSSSGNVYAKRSLSTAAPLILNALQQKTIGSSVTRQSYDGQAYGIAPTVGNLTAMSTWDDMGGQWLTLNKSYGAYGNLASLTNPKGNVTYFYYDDSTYALPTRILVDPLNGTGQQITSTTYDYYTGLVTNTTDPNGQTATIDYTNQLLGAVDPFGRPGVATGPFVMVNGANHRRKVFTFYEDSARRTRVESDLNSEGDRLLKSRETRDQLGRVVLAEESENGSSFTTSSQTVYIQMGRVILQSYPTRGDGSSPDGWTRVTNDSAGRVIEAASFTGTAQPPASGTNSDWKGSTTTSYYANEMTITDQQNKSRKSVTDASGKLVKLIEDPAGLAYETFYTYDVLGNLRKVHQGAQSRYFMYDSLSRLIRAKNVEQGNISNHPDVTPLTDPVTQNSQWSLAYAYDQNSNIIMRVDAGGAKTTYDYDALNRNTTVDYSSTSNINPDITRAYDGATNGKGRFWYSYAGGNYSTGSTVEHTAIDAFDAMGRPLTQRQLFKSNGSWGPTYAVQCSYDLAGNVRTGTYPSGHTVNYAYDNAGRLTSFTGNLGDGSQRTYATGISYDASSRMKQEQFGTNVPVYNKRFYNGSGQLSEIRVSTTPNDSSWNRGAIINHYSNQVSAGTGTDNNGTLKKQDHWIPRDDAVSAYDVYTQTYEYDSLKRLQSVSETMNGGAVNWQQVYQYDRYGNRTIDQANTWGTGIPEPQFTVDTNTNRLNVPGGMAGVMQYDAAGNLWNDTYTGYGNRTFDGENRMLTVVDNIGGTSRYAYDASGQRVRHNTAGQETWHVYGMGGELLAEYTASASSSSPQKEYGYRNGQLLVTAAGPQRTNVALAANGSVASASSTNVYNGNPFPASRAIDGDRRGLNYMTGGVWQSNSTSLPQWLQIDFPASATIDEIDLLMLQDSYANPSEPTQSMTFSWYGLTAFDVQYWNGSAWVTVPGSSVTGNDKVWRKFTFSPITTAKIRVLTNASPDGWSRLAEVEAWGTSAPQRINVALPANGGSASASSVLTYQGNPFPANRAIDGDRRGLNYNTGGVWQSSDTTLPQWLQVDFQGNKAIDEIDLFTLQDGYANPSEPTETMTFTYYGLTGFEVQYWNGSSWVTVPGGNVTGNYKVWKKFTFSPITTSKIRVLTSASPDSWSRITEVEAWQGASGSSSAEISWLVADHLGTPRIIVDQTGNLTGVKRHDYLPFGEELWAGTGGRTAQQGYGVNDNVRQKFTGYERDSETGLDFAQARYYSATLGRFTTPDPLLSSGYTVDPQSWNKYSYVKNRPLNNIDPSGLWDWDASLGGKAEDAELRANVCADKICTEEEKKAGKRSREEVERIIAERERFRQAINYLKDLLGSSLLTPAEQKRIGDAVRAYGERNDGNGVIIVSSTLNPDSGAFLTAQAYGYSWVFLSDPAGQGRAGWNLGVLHEGQHVVDYINYLNGSGADLTQFDYEVSGFVTEGIGAKAALKGQGFYPQRGSLPASERLWDANWPKSQADIETMRNTGAINRVEQGYETPAGAPLTRANKGVALGQREQGMKRLLFRPHP